MKKFDQINKYMDGNKTVPVQKTTSIDFLPVSKFLYHHHNKYDHGVVIKFFEANNIILKNFYSAGKCDQECTTCGNNDWLVWQNEFMYYDTLNKCFIQTEDDEELEPSSELAEIDFAVHICARCGAWSTFIL